MTRARHALFWEHLWPWLPGYLDAVDHLGTHALGPWPARHESRRPAGDIVHAWWAARAARTGQLLTAGQAVR